VRILEPHTVTILTTDKCTAECRHCCMNSSPEREHRLTYAQIERALRQFFDHYNIKVVVFAGGEPTLLGKDLLDAIRFCKLNGVVSRIVTNAYWAHSYEAALAKCTELREAGLDEFNVSMDDYHEPYISFERVKNAYEAALTLDFTAVVIANCVGTKSSFTPEHLEQQFGMSCVQMQRRFDVDGFSKYFERVEGGKLIVLSNANVQRLGRGLDLVDDEECSYDCDMAQVPPEAEAFGGCPWAVRSSAVSARNHLVACCGFELHGNPVLDFGDLEQNAVQTLIDKADDDLITNMIGLLGPPKIMQLLKEICPDEVSFPRKIYHSYCETCQDLVGLEQNRRALYKHQGLFADVILRARAELDERFRDAGGRVDPSPIRLPGVRVVSTAPESEAGPGPTEK
jgi:hypothetical protein